MNYYDPNVFPALTDATVVVSDNSGNSETLVQTSDGIYQSTTLQGVAGRLYSLKVSYNGKDYESHSTMPSMVPIDSVMIVLNPPGGGGFGGGHPGDSIPGYKVTCIFKDPPGQGNYYRLVLNSNDTAAIDKSRYRIVSDKLTDDDNISITANTKLKPGDSVTVILECIDQAAYNFFNTLGNVVGDSPPFMSAPPANPVTNISNGGLGYFSAYSYSEKKLVVH